MSDKGTTTGADRNNNKNSSENNEESSIKSIVEEKINLDTFKAISGQMAGYPFVKVVVERKNNKIHFINDQVYKFHGLYIAETLLGITQKDLFDNIDQYNKSFYLKPDREFFLGIVAFHSKGSKPFFTLETVEIDNMNAEMVQTFRDKVREHLDPAFPLLFKPANHLQEKIVGSIDRDRLPRIFNHELFASSPFVVLNEGEAIGRLRYFENEKDYRDNISNLEWHDIIVMKKVPEDIPRVSGIINTLHTTPLSHTNVLAVGWQIPNSIQIGFEERLQSEGLDNQWVNYKVQFSDTELDIQISDPPSDILQRPQWTVQRVSLEAPDIVQTPIKNLDHLRMMDRFRYGTKAANLGELRHIITDGSQRLLGFYQIKRPPRPNLLQYVADFLGSKSVDSEVLQETVWDYIKESIEIPRGIAIPFSVQQEFLTTSAQIQQQIGKLKMALELGAREIDSLCLTLQQMIRNTRMSDQQRDYIDNMIVKHLGGVSSFVVRSSSNAEDLENFSAAGIYESINHVTTADKIFQSIKEVWASLVSPRSVRLRHEVGISLDDCYMGVIIQEEVESSMGGVMVTMNPTNSADFRDVFLNVSTQSVNSVVEGTDLPFQYLFNTVEGGGKTLSLGNAKEDLPEEKKEVLQKLAFIGRFLQSHFSKDYTFSAAQDIEWAIHGQQIYILQLRPYAK